MSFKIRAFLSIVIINIIVFLVILKSFHNTIKEKEYSIVTQRLFLQSKMFVSK